MGQESYSDSKWIDLVCARLIELGKRLSGNPNSAWMIEELIAGKSVTGRIGLLPDYEANDGTLCVRIFVHPVGANRNEERAVYFRRGKASRKLDNAKALRKLGKFQKTDESRNMVQSSRDIYWDNEAPMGDLKAQLIIAVLQMRLLTMDSDVFGWLSDYIRDTYQIHFRTQGSRQDDIQTRNEIALLVAHKLVKQWSYPEDFRAFRKYIFLLIGFACGEVLDSSNQKTNASVRELWELPNEVEGTITDKVFRHVNREDGALLAQNRLELTVEEASGRLAISERYIYKLCQKGIIIGKGYPILIPKSEVLRIGHLLELKKQRQDERTKMEELGRTSTAARKAIYRKHGALPKLAP